MPAAGYLFRGPSDMRASQFRFEEPQPCCEADKNNRVREGKQVVIVIATHLYNLREGKLYACQFRFEKLNPYASRKTLRVLSK